MNIYEQKYEFRECDFCRRQPGSPILCSGCLHNRTSIELLRAEIERKSRVHKLIELAVSLNK